MTYGTGIYDKDRMIVPIAIREDLTARLQIPTDLTLAEAEKIARVVVAYATDATSRDGIEWRPAPGWEGLYEVSRDGQIRSLYAGPRNRIPTPDADGYLRVCLIENGRRRTESLHRLVCRAFHGEPTALHNQVAHLDGNRANPRADNLKWVSKVENHFHMRAHGTHQFGEKHPRAKLREQDVIEIRRSPLTYKQLAAKFGVSIGAIDSVRRRKTWKHVPDSAISSKSHSLASQEESPNDPG